MTLPLLCRHKSGNLCKLARFVGKQNGNRENTIPLDQAVLDDGSHRNYIHISAAQNRNNLFLIDIQMFQGRNSQRPEFSTIIL